MAEPAYRRPATLLGVHRFARRAVQRTEHGAVDNVIPLAVALLVDPLEPYTEPFTAWIPAGNRRHVTPVRNRHIAVHFDPHRVEIVGLVSVALYARQERRLAVDDRWRSALRPDVAVDHAEVVG